MNFQTAIDTQITNDIAATCKVSAKEAAKQLKLAKATAKALGLDLATVLLGLGICA